MSVPKRSGSWDIASHAEGGPMARVVLAGLVVITAQLFAAPPVLAAELPTACSYLSRYVEAQAPGPEFLASFPTVKSGPLQGAAFLYDNAVAAIALVACDKP